ncbi:MAG: hypothetical protein CMJ48_12100 [Planctomycetaceae bacterium]|nr:hypothetical protein [Planctomycetaceae bacterium]
MRALDDRSLRVAHLTVDPALFRKSFSGSQHVWRSRLAEPWQEPAGEFENSRFRFRRPIAFKFVAGIARTNCY